MNLKEIRELIEIVSANPAIEEFEFERSGVRVHIRRGGGSPPVSAASDSPEPARIDVSGAESVPEPEPATPAEAGLHEITSPMVGTFYRAPAPDADPFVKVGDFIEKGTVICIIEAMKLMNEIESEVAGEVVSVRVENGHPVEYGDVLLVVRPS